MNNSIINRHIENKEFKEAIELLKESVYFMNQVPNYRYMTCKDDMNHYKLCGRIDRFLNKDKK